ncbi:MAG: undecaprenyl-phosphate glucose phosphotransferase, partial [Xanthobacteraceae bacterium]
MSLGSEIRGDVRQAVHLQQPSVFSGDSIPYLLAMSDAFVILLTSVLGGIAYQSAVGNPVPALVPYCAVGLLASFIYILRMSGAGHYDFPDSAKPRVEFNDIMICWLSTGLLLAFFAFLLKVGVEYSRGAFVAFYFLTPAALLGVRKATKQALVSAVARGAFARRDIVLIGDADEVAALGSPDMLTLFGAADVARFTLSRDHDPSARATDDGRILASAVQFARASHCQEIVLALPWSATDRIDVVRDAIKVLPVAARLLPD